MMTSNDIVSPNFVFIVVSPKMEEKELESDKQCYIYRTSFSLLVYNSISKIVQFYIAQ